MYKELCKYVPKDIVNYVFLRYIDRQSETPFKEAKDLCDKQIECCGVNFSDNFNDGTIYNLLRVQDIVDKCNARFGVIMREKLRENIPSITATRSLQRKIRSVSNKFKLLNEELKWNPKLSYYVFEATHLLKCSREWRKREIKEETVRRIERNKYWELERSKTYSYVSKVYNDMRYTNWRDEYCAWPEYDETAHEACWNDYVERQKQCQVILSKTSCGRC